MASGRRRSIAGRTKAAAALLLRARTVRAYRKVFLRDGKLTPEAAIVLHDLGLAAGMGKAVPGGTAEELNFREGRRAVVLHLFARLDAQTLDRLAQLIREATTNDDPDA